VNLSTSVLFDVFALNQSVSRLLDAAMAGGPLSPTEYALYSAIFELEAASPTTIAERLGMPLTTLVDRLREIEGRGHLRRLPNAADGRSYLVALSGDGQAAHRAANREFEVAIAAVRGHLEQGEAAAKAAIGDLRDAVDGAYAALRLGSGGISPRRLRGRAG
jgi:DNA-binding MarR family transcriptional regulator